mmetsp:Transcript_21954/g.62323  ORF Transcript_21954/g.62323 Transcript_21954/m.62323 type:complete len:578 (+) Transcript_21954:106-1839(+)
MRPPTCGTAAERRGRAGAARARNNVRAVCHGEAQPLRRLREVLARLVARKRELHGRREALRDRGHACSTPRLLGLFLLEGLLGVHRRAQLLLGGLRGPGVEELEVAIADGVPPLAADTAALCAEVPEQDLHVSVPGELVACPPELDEGHQAVAVSIQPLEALVDGAEVHLGPSPEGPQHLCAFRVVLPHADALAGVLVQIAPSSGVPLEAEPLSSCPKVRPHNDVGVAPVQGLAPREERVSIPLHEEGLHLRPCDGVGLHVGPLRRPPTIEPLQVLGRDDAAAVAVQRLAQELPLTLVARELTPQAPQRLDEHAVEHLLLGEPRPALRPGGLGRRWALPDPRALAQLGVRRRPVLQPREQQRVLCAELLQGHLSVVVTVQASPNVPRVHLQVVLAAIRPQLREREAVGALGCEELAKRADLDAVRLDEVALERHPRLLRVPLLGDRAAVLGERGDHRHLLVDPAEPGPGGVAVPRGRLPPRYEAPILLHELHILLRRRSPPLVQAARLGLEDLLRAHLAVDLQKNDVLFLDVAGAGEVAAIKNRADLNLRRTERTCRDEGMPVQLPNATSLYAGGVA